MTLTETEPLSVLLFMLEGLTAPARCNLLSLHLRHLSAEGRAHGKSLCPWGAQGLFCVRCSPIGGRGMSQKTRREGLFSPLPPAI